MRKCERSEQIKEERMKEGENVLLVWSCMQYESASLSPVVSAASGVWSDGRNGEETSPRWQSYVCSITISDGK